MPLLKSINVLEEDPNSITIEIKHDYYCVSEDDAVIVENEYDLSSGDV